MAGEKDLAIKILELVGGKDNVNATAYCMTRLRLTIVDKSLVDMAALKNTPKVLGVVEAAGQLQIILGPGLVNKVAGEVAAITGNTEKKVQDLKAERDDKNRTPLKLFLRNLANVFVPLIPPIVASGMIAGITNIVIRMGCDPKSSLVLILNALGWGIFAYLAVFVGINAAKEFGGTPSMGGLAGVLIINPAISSITVYNANLVPGRGGLIGVLLVTCFMCWVEKKLRKFIPDSLDVVLRPALTLLITGFATYYVLQPVGGVLSDGIVDFFKLMLNQGGVIAGYILAGTFLPIVMTGLHQGLIPIHMELLNTLKENALFPILAMAGGGQVGAVIAIYFKTQNKQMKEMIKGALPVGIMGIAEPLIFGITLPLGRPFITACIGSGFGGAWIAFTHVSSIAIGVSGLPFAFLIKEGYVFNYLLGLLIACIAAFVVTWFVGFEDPQNEELSNNNNVSA